MRPVILSIVALLASAAILQLGNGLQFTLLPVRADMAAFGSGAIAFVGSAYFTGFLLGSIMGPQLIGQVGHIRMLTAGLAGVSASILIYPLFLVPGVWFGARLVTGFCLAVAYMAIESWLNERAPASARGSLFALYSLVAIAMLAGGQGLYTLFPVEGFELFSVAAICVAVAAVPIALTRSAAPAVVPQPRLRLASLLGVSRVAVVGSVTVGLSNSAFWAFGPIFAVRAASGAIDVAAFMAAALLGGAVMMWPIGAFSDRVDRRLVAGFVSLGAAIAALGIVLLADRSVAAVLACSFVFGGFTFTLYPVCVAHANDNPRGRDFVQVASGLLFLFGASSLFGPLLAGLVLDGFGPAAIFLTVAFVHAAGAVAIFLLQRLRPAIRPEEKEAFQPSPRTTQAAFLLHEDHTNADIPPQDADVGD